MAGQAKEDRLHADRDEQVHQQMHVVIGEQIMNLLGQPADLLRLQVRKLWDDHYRVNVLVGADAVSVRVAHSFFLTTDGKGAIVASTPAITKRY